MNYDVIIVGGGPGGLAAALTLGRARKRVLLCDAGPRRNAAAVQVHNFVTRDGTPPDVFRQVGREQLAAYPNVEVRDVQVASITGTRGAFHITLASGSVEALTARRVLLCTGMIDEMLPIDGFGELWGHAIFQCPYCHGWEVQDRAWGYLVRETSMLLPFALNLRGWTQDLVVFTQGVDVPAATHDALQAAGIRVETAPVARLVGEAQRLEAVELADGTRVPREVLFVHPPQRQVELVRGLGVAFDAEGYVQVDAMRRETSVAGIYAAGDLTTRGQAAIFAASTAVQAASMINVELAMEPAGR